MCIRDSGMGEAKDNPKAIEAACGDLAAITGQKPIITKAKKSVANFKLREGMNIEMCIRDSLLTVCMKIIMIFN